MFCPPHFHLFSLSLSHNVVTGRTHSWNKNIWDTKVFLVTLRLVYILLSDLDSSTIFSRALRGASPRVVVSRLVLLVLLPGGVAGLRSFILVLVVVLGRCSGLVGRVLKDMMKGSIKYCWVLPWMEHLLLASYERINKELKKAFKVSQENRSHKIMNIFYTFWWIAIITHI